MVSHSRSELAKRAMLITLIRGIGHFSGSLFILYTLVFFATLSIPVDPARAILGPAASEDAVSRLRSELGLEDSPLVQYARGLRRGVRGDFGESFYFREPAINVVTSLAPITLARAGCSLIVGTIAGFGAAYLSALFSLSWVRRSFIVTQSTPSFVVMVLILAFFSRATGVTPLANPFLYEVLTVLGAAIYPYGLIGLYVREYLTPPSQAPHVDFLRMLHVPRIGILRFLALEAIPGSLVLSLNSVLPVLTAVSFAEIIFSVPGFGFIFFRSCERGDITIVLAGTMLLGFLVLTLQRAGDLAIGQIDPRIARGNW